VRADRQKDELGLRLCNAIHWRRDQPHDEDLAFWYGIYELGGLNRTLPPEALHLLKELPRQGLEYSGYSLRHCGERITK
jgi:hypothetical protein